MLRKASIKGFTLTEMMVSLSCGLLILGAVVVAGVSLQKSYAALQSYSTAEADQLRVLDYIAMDCRRAISASVTTSNDVNGVPQSQLVLKLPAYYSSSTSNSAIANIPNSGTGTLAYGSTASGSFVANTDIVTVTYQQNSRNFTREVKVTDSTLATTRSDVTTAIATNVSSFTANPIDLTKSVSCSIMFFPNFLHYTGNGLWRSGQYAPHDRQPDDTLGSNGDWYAINSTVTDATQNGDVYFKSGGHYAKIQNVKATTVAIQTFLRNAVARN